MKMEIEPMSSDYPDDPKWKSGHHQLCLNGLYKNAMLGSHMYDQVNKIRKEYRRYWRIF